VIDLKHWNAFQTFTCKQAACLIAGLEPSHQTVQSWTSLSTELWSIVLMEEHYKNALVFSQAGGFDAKKYGDLLLPMDLQSVDLERLRLKVNAPNYEQNFWEWAKNGGDFKQQKFSRFELSRWVKAKKISSSYQFDLTVSEDTGASDKGSAAQEILQKSGKTLPTEEAKKNGTEKRWTESELKRLRLYRDSHTEKQTAAHFEVSGSLVRRLLQGLKKADISHKKSSPFDGLGKR
jgi:hypothetical protein